MWRCVLALACFLSACGSSQPKPTPGWMSNIDDATNLAQLSIPGTHESAALYEPAMGTAKCQNLPLAEQLTAGVRYFDIRCRDLNGMFAIFHGPIDEQQTFDNVLATMFDFLDKHPTETIIMSIKEESTAEGTTRSFEATFDAYAAQAPDRWYLGATVPVLGDVRGKIVLLRRFTATAALGVDASMWADNTTFTLSDTNATLQIEDQYQVTSTDTKWMEITANLTAARAATNGTLFLTYTSGYMLKSGLPDVTAVESVIDPMLDTYFSDPTLGQAHLGTLAIDFIDEYKASLVIATN